MSIIKNLKRDNCSICNRDYNGCYIYARAYAFNVVDMLDINGESISCKELDRDTSIEHVQEECV